MANREFMFIRPYCVQTLENPSVDSVQALCDAVQQVDAVSLQQLQDYIMVPLIEILSTSNRNEALTVITLDCISTLLTSTEIRSWKLFSKTTFLVIMMISSQDKSETEPIAKVSDEIKTAVLACLKTLLDHSGYNILEIYYSTKFLTQLGHIVFLLLNVAEKDNARDARLLAMKYLAVVCKRHDNVTLRRQAADTLATFLPGLSMGLTKVAVDGGIAGHVVVEASIDLLAELICNVLGDDLTPVEPNTTNTPDITENGPRGLAMTVRNVEWIASTAQKLLILVQKLTSLDCHSHWRVRLALARWAGRLLLKCKRSMEESVPVLLGVIITMSLDEYASVAKLCRETLNSFSAALDPKDRSLLELLQENFYCTVLQLPMIVRRSDDAKKLSVLNQLCGYISIMGSSVDLILSSSSHLEKLSLSLMQMTELDCGHFHLVAEHAPVAMYALQETRLSSASRQRRQFLHFQDENIALRIYELCGLIGKWGKFDLTVDHFVDRIHESSVYRKQAILLLNEVIFGAKQRCSDDPQFSAVAHKIISSICEEYMSLSLWNIQVTHTDDNADTAGGGSNYLHDVVRLQPIVSEVEISLSSLNSNAMQVCLLLEGLSNCAKVLGDRFNPLLMKVLYNVLEKMGSTSAVVSYSAFICLSRIATSCGHGALSELILANADYLLNSLSIKLRYNPTDMKGPTVFRVALQHGDHRVLMLAEDILDEILAQVDKFHNEQLGIYLSVLLSLVVAVRKWCPPTKVSQSTKTKIPTMETPVAKFDIKRIILAYDRAKKDSQNFGDEVDVDDYDSTQAHQNHLSDENENDYVEQDAIAEDSDAQEAPVHIRMVVKVLQRCGHLLPTQSTLLAVSVLDIISASVDALQDHENVLLPLVHKTWAPIVCRMNDKQPPVLRAVIRTLCMLANTCGDFIRQRVLKEAWPKVIEFLEKNTKISISNNFRRNLTFRLLVDMLANAGILAKSLKLPVLDADNLASAAALYLSSRQPVEIQEAAVSLFTELSALHPDLVWLKLSDLFCEEENIFLNAKFKPIKLHGCNPSSKEFAKNVLMLLHRS